MAKRIGPEAKIIALFTALSEDSQRIVFDILNSQSPRKVSSPKSVAPSASKRSSRKQEGAAPIQSIEGDKESVSSVSSKCRICGNSEAHEDHQHGSPNYHIFRTKLKKKDNGGTMLLDNPEDSQHGAPA